MLIKPKKVSIETHNLQENFDRKLTEMHTHWPFLYRWNHQGLRKLHHVRIPQLFWSSVNKNQV